MTKIDFKVEDKDYYIVKPSSRQEKDGMIMFARSLTKYVKDGIFSQEKLDSYLREQGVWDDEKQKEMEEIAKFVKEGADKLASGGIKKSEARKLAIEMRGKRFQFMQLTLEKTQLENFTVEALADADRTDFYISCCTKNSDGSKVFKDFDDYQDKKDTELGKSAALNFAKLHNGYNEDFAHEFVENKFLKEYGFVNDKLELVNEEGKYVDVDGNVVEEPQKVEFKEFLEG